MRANSPKSRDYFITINKGAKCYDEVLDIIQSLNVKLYALITHDKDVNLVSNDVLGTTEEIPKEVHKHCVIELVNPVSFNSMQSKFVGAHIETPKYKKSAYQYLIHNRPNAKDKYQYSLNDIISNSIETIQQIIESEDNELFYQGRFMEYIADGIRTPYQFVKRFGLDAYKQYWKPYYDMICCLDSDLEMASDLKALINARAKDELF